MIKKGFSLLFVIIFILQGIPLYSQETLSLDSLIKEARENNPEILAAKKRWEASLARVPQAKSLDNPTIALEFEKIPRGTLKLDRVMPDDRMLLINQALPWFGKLPLKKKIAVVEFQMAVSEHKNKELEIINMVKNAYFDLFMNYKEIELNQESLEFLKALSAIAEAKYVVGEIMQEDVFKIHSEIAKISNNIANLKQENLAKQTKLNALLNREPESILGEPILEESLYFNNDIKHLYLLTLENNPELLIFSYAIERNKFAKSLAKKSFFPDLMAELTLRGVTSGAIGAWDLMLAFSMPLWFWTKQRYEVKEAIANLEEAQAVYQAMKNKALSETKDLATKIEIAKNKINLYKHTQIPILESSIQSSLSSYKSGKGDIMMLIDSERMLIEARMDYYKALVEYNMSLADLERATGGNLTQNQEVTK